MKPHSDPPIPPQQDAWRLNPARATAWRLWEGEAVVYDDLSGDTLKLDVVMTEVFKSLLDKPSRLHELSERLAIVLELENDERLQHVIQTALNRLAACGLAEGPPAASPAPGRVGDVTA